MLVICSARKERLLGAMLVGLGIVCNQWFLARTLSPDGMIEHLPLRAVIWAFELSCLVAGSLLILFGTAALDRIYRHSWWGILVFSALLSGLWLVAIEQISAGWKLFEFIGADYAIYSAQANVLRSDDPRGIYNLDALQFELQRLYDQYVHETARATHVPYPPLFAWLFRPFIELAPHTGLILWTVLNALAALYLAWRAAGFFHETERPVVTLLVLSSYPVIFALILGQPVLFLACAVAEFYLALRAGRDLRAGLFLSLLLFKPQYGVLLGPLLIVKQRWVAVMGAVLGVAVIIAGSIIVAGFENLLNYPAAFTQMSQFRGDVPAHMINWRSLLLWFSPHITDASGMLSEMLLSAFTVLLTLFAWRGEWAPLDECFPLLISLTLIATLLASHHSLQHGAVLLAVPMAAAMAQAHLSRFTRIVFILACLVPAASFTLIYFLNIVYASRLLTIFLLMVYATLVGELWRRRALYANSGVYAGLDPGTMA
jgi:hypothetical protein